MSDERSTKRDMVLPPGTYAYMQDVTKGVIKTYTGPTVINPTAQEVPVVYNAEEGRFEKSDLESAVRRAVIAPEGFYIILLNPAKGSSAHPAEGTTQASADLDVGRKVVIPGPAMFPLWPGQAAHVIRGHQIRLNQYILARVYNEEEAKKNWTQAVMKPATKTVEGSDVVATQEEPQDLSVGTQIIIRGDEVSFYIPPTGIAVVKDGDQYVREALTLERLEYAILKDEDGNKRYEKGPQVVFPKPTEVFLEGKGEDSGQPTRKFRAIELNELQGLHIKVIADYTENGKTHKAGDELFITGKETAIYYPREEHSAIKYDGKTKHFATAIPAGEARYVMNRNTGEIKTIRGPHMLLPDPRSEVIVRRVLTEKQAAYWYPDNMEVMEYNRLLRSILSSVPTTRAGAVSEGDFERNSRGAGQKMVRSATVSLTKGMLSNAAPARMESSQVGGDQQLQGDEFSRASSYSQPRTIDLNTKFQGAPGIEPYTGYAVQIVSKTGKRRVEKGPAAILLDYDESLEVLELSSGKPKTTDRLLHTVYLRVDNNKVTDHVKIETADHVEVELYLSYLINFEGDSLKWFNVENYVKFACDHIRSILKGSIRKLKVEDFYANSTDILRDIILSKSVEKGKRPGMVFEENNMRVADVEVLKVQIADEQIRSLLNKSQKDVVQSNIELSALRRGLSLTQQKEEITRQEQTLKAETKKLLDQSSIELLTSTLAVQLTQLGNNLKTLDAQKEEKRKAEEITDLTTNARLDRLRLEQTQALEFSIRNQEQAIQMLQAETQSTVAKFASAMPGLSEALISLGNKETMVQVAKAWSLQTAIGGENVAEAIHKAFVGTPVEALAKKIAAMAANGSNLVSPSSQPSVS